MATPFDFLEQHALQTEEPAGIGAEAIAVPEPTPSPSPGISLPTPSRIMEATGRASKEPRVDPVADKLAEIARLKAEAEKREADPAFAQNQDVQRKLLEIQEARAIARREEEEAGIEPKIAQASDAFVRQLAKTIDAPIDAVKMALKSVGAGQLSGAAPIIGPLLQSHSTLEAATMEPGEDAGQALEKAFVKMGLIRSEELGTVAERLGRNTFNNAVTLSALWSIAPRMAVWGGGAAGARFPAISQWVRDTGRSLLEAPAWKQFMAESGAVAGITYLGEKFRGSPAEPVAEFAGAMAGGITGLGTANVMGKTARRLDDLVAKAPPVRWGIERTREGAETIAGMTRPGTLVGDVARRVADYRRPPPEPGGPLRLDPAAQEQFAERATQFTSEQVADAELRIRTGIERQLNRVVATGGKEEAQQNTFDAMRRAFQIGRRIEGEYWNAAPLGRRVTGGKTGIGGALTRMNADLADEPPENIPRDLMDRLGALVYPTQDPATGRMIPTEVTIRRLRKEAGVIAGRMVNEMGATARGFEPNRELIANYIRLQNIINDGIATALPSTRSIVAARRVSTIFHDLFTRNFVGDVLARRQRGDRPIHPTEFMERGFKGPARLTDELTRIPGRLSTIPHARGRFGRAASPAERRELEQLTQHYENSVRSIWRDSFMAARGLPEDQAGEAIKFVENHLPKVRSMARVAAEMDSVRNNLEQHVAELETLGRSAAARLAGGDTSDVVRRIMAKSSPWLDLGELAMIARRDPDGLAIHGLRDAWLEHFFKATTVEPDKIRDLIASSKWGRTAAQVLSRDELNRLKRMANAAVRLREEYSPVGWKRALHHVRLLNVASRLVGAWAGRHVARWTGGGSVQMPGITANATAKVTEAIFSNMDPSLMFKLAVNDPEWEKILLSRVPRSSEEMRFLLGRMNRVIYSIEFAKNRALRLPEPENTDEE